MKKSRVIAVLLAGFVMSTSTVALALCREQLDPYQAQGRNAWAAMWGYITPDQEATLNAQGNYVEFATGCYNLAGGGACQPSIPVMQGGAFVPGLAMTSFCPASDCYTPSQKIQSSGKEVEIADAATGQFATVTTLAAHATLESPATTETRIASISSAPVFEKIFVLYGNHGERLEVTGGHPMVLSNGVLSAARNLKAGDELAGAGGVVIRLASVQTYDYAGDVWNVTPKSEEKLANIIIAQGFLAGSLRFQAEWGHQRFRLIVRDRMDAISLLAGE